MAIQSIWTPVEVRDITGDHFFMAPGEMTFGEVHFVGELDNLAQEVGARSEAFDNARNLSSAGVSAPEIVGGGNVSGGFVIFGDSDFCFFRHGQ